MQKKFYLILVLVLILLPTSKVFAQETFNPHYIISNNDITDYTAMNMDDVYTFLKSKEVFYIIILTQTRE